MTYFGKLLKQVARLTSVGVVSLAILATPVQAQTGVQILCDTTFAKFQTVRPLPGEVYSVLFPGDGQVSYQLERSSSDGTQRFDIPVPSELSGKINPYETKLSPDNRYLAFRPLYDGTSLLVWKIGTSEIATLPLAPEDAAYLTIGVHPRTRQRNEFVWSDNSHLVIQYFDLDYGPFDRLLATKTLTVMDTPFQITQGARVDTGYPNLTPPTPSLNPAMTFSPQHTYVTLASRYRETRYQIYNTQTQQLVADFQSDATREFVNEPIWTPDESRFFMFYRMNPGSSPVQHSLVEVDVNTNFQITDGLRQSLETTFGTGLTFVPYFTPMLNAAGDKLVAQIYVPDQQQYYWVMEQLGTGEITAICDDGFLSPTGFPVWGPEDRYFGYVAGGWVVALDLTTGQRYEVEKGRTFAGWTAASDGTPIH